MAASPPLPPVASALPPVAVLSPWSMVDSLLCEEPRSSFSRQPHLSPRSDLPPVDSLLCLTNALLDASPSPPLALASPPSPPVASPLVAVVSPPLASASDSVPSWRALFFLLSFFFLLV